MKQIKPNIHWRSVALGTGIGVLTMVILTAAAAGLMAKGIAPVESMDYWSAGILVLTGLLGALAAMLGRGEAIDCALSALGELVVLMGINLALCGGKMEGFAVTALALGGGCGAAVLLSLGRSRGHRRRRRRRKS